jgi:hypothetical protein
MIQISGINENQVVSIAVTGTVQKEEIQALEPDLKAMFEKFGRLRFFIDLRGLEHMDAGAAFEDLKFDAHHKDHYGRTAIVGENKWQEFGTKVSNLFFEAELKYFEPHQADEAWNWVNTQVGEPANR